MDIKKAKKELKTRTEHFRQFLNSQIWVETDIEAVNVVLNELDKKESDLYEANNRIVDLMDIIDERDKIINLMAEQLTTPVHGIDWVIDYFTKKVEGK